MEHREPPRAVAAEGRGRDIEDDPVARPRFARFVPSSGVRRLAPSRIGLALMASVAVLALAVIAGSKLVHSLTKLVQDQPQYMLEFTATTLDPPPPPWIKGGAKGFLERVRKRVGLPERASVLDLDLHEVTRAFRHDAWVKKVERAGRSYPNRLEVRLVYREPVAFFQNVPRLVIDEEAALLPADEIDWGSLRPLIAIVGIDRSPADRTPGTYWMTGDDAVLDESIRDAARLASLLRSVQSGGGPPASFQFRKVYPRTKKNGLFTRANEGLWVLWGEPPGAETPGQPSAAEKWALLRDWLDRHPASELKSSGNDYLMFTKAGIQRRPVTAQR